MPERDDRDGLRGLEEGPTEGRGDSQRQCIEKKKKTRMTHPGRL